MSAAVPLVALVGNPNTGKTTLFNRLTGQNERVGNYPGVTVERRVGRATRGGFDVLDVPGAYSLSARSAEEQVAIEAVLGIDGNPRPDLVVVVLDATQLVRNLYLAGQLAELGLPLLAVVNFLDETGGRPPDLAALGALLGGVPVVATSGRSGEGLDALQRGIVEALARPTRGRFAPAYPDALRADAAALAAALPAAWAGPPAEAVALWAYTSIDEDDELMEIPAALRQAVLACRAAALAASRDPDAEIIGARYAVLDAAAPGLLPPAPARRLTERVDAVLLHPVGGFLAFLAIMLTLFQALFSGADPLIQVIEAAVGAVGDAVAALLPAGFVQDLLVEGVIGGVGNVVVFLPQILLLFLFIGLLEDSGYMARAAYLMDRVMRGLGLHGRAFVPLLSGFACAVPAIMATRTMERQRDRLLTMLVVPLMTCSARLPVYTLIIASLFPPAEDAGGWPVQGLLMMALYLFSVVVALLAAAVLGRTVLKGPRVPLLLELPPYRVPLLRTTLRLMRLRAGEFLKEAGTVILACTVLMWALLKYPALPPPADYDTLPAASQAAFDAARLEHSAAGRVGKAIEPAIAPLGFDWKIGVGVIGAFAAREVFVSTMGLVYGMGGDVDEASTPLRDRIRAERRPDGTPVYTPLSGLSLLVFFALACQCMSTLAVLKRETRSWRWPAFLFVYMTALAWVCSFLVYQGGRLLGLG